MAQALEEKDIKKSVDKINTQIEAQLFEKRVRKELVGDTIPVLLALEQKRKTKSLLIKKRRSIDIKEMKNGAVKL